MTATMTRVALYARFSSDKQNDASIEDQQRSCRRHAERQPGWHIVETYSDAALSGATEDRPGLQSLIAGIRAGRFDVILAESLDRIARNEALTHRFYDLCRYHAVRIVTLADGEATRLNVSVKGLMSAIELDQLAARTLRGLQGRVLSGRSVGPPPYGYTLVRRLNEAGDLDRGLWEINPAEASVIQRIFTLYADGASPRQIAKILNQEGVPSPNNGIWYDSSIRGQDGRGDGILRRETYRGRIVFGRQHRVRNPDTGRSVKRKGAAQNLVSQERPDLRIIDDALWQRVQDRLATFAVQTTPETRNDSAPPGAFWGRRRPKHLLTGKVFCGSCNRGFRALGKDYLGCDAARTNACRNNRRLRRAHLEAQVMQDIGSQLMDPDLVAVAIEAFNAELKTLSATLAQEAKAAKQQLKQVKSQIATLIDNLSLTRGSPSMLQRLTDLETEAARLEQKAAETTQLNLHPSLHPGNAQIYKAKVNALHEALTTQDNTAALEAARALIDRIIVHPPETDDDPPRIEVIGELTELLKTSGIAADSPAGPSQPSDAVLDLFASSVKDGPGARPSRQRRAHARRRVWAEPSASLTSFKTSRHPPPTEGCPAKGLRVRRSRDNPDDLIRLIPA